MPRRTSTLERPRAPENSPPAASAPSSGTTAAGAIPSAKGSSDAEEDLFAAAQTAHFEARDPERALRAWDGYLATYPRGRFVLEARYNRAATLIRLGRDEEARGALLPFLNGSYRAREARTLLEALGRDR